MTTPASATSSAPAVGPRSFAHRIVHAHLVDVLLLTDVLFTTWLRDDDATCIAFASMDRSAVQLVYSRLHLHTSLMLEQVLLQWPRAIAAMNVPDNIVGMARETLQQMQHDDDDDDDDRPSKRARARARTDDASRNHRTHPTSTILNFHQRHVNALDEFDSDEDRERHLELLSCTRVWHPSPSPPPSNALHHQPPHAPTLASLDAFLASPLPLFRTVYCADPRVYSAMPPVLRSRITDARFAAALALPRGRRTQHPVPVVNGDFDDECVYDTYDRKRSGCASIRYRLDAEDLVDYRLLHMLAPLTTVARPRLLPAGTTFVYVERASMNELRPGDFPTSVRHLVFASNSLYNRPFEPGALPAALMRLVFLARAEYNQPFAPGVLPPALQRLSFNGAYRHAFSANSLPESLRQLEFRWSSRAGSRTVIDASSLPDSLERLGFHRFDMIETAASLCRLFTITTSEDQPLAREDVLESDASYGDVHRTQLEVSSEGNSDGGSSLTLRCDVAFGSYSDASQLPPAPIPLAVAITIFVEGIIAQVSAGMAPLQPLTAQQLADLRAHLRSAAFVDAMANAHLRLYLRRLRGAPTDEPDARSIFERSFLEPLLITVGDFRLLGGAVPPTFGVPDLRPERFVRDTELPAQVYRTGRQLNHFLSGRIETVVFVELNRPWNPAPRRLLFSILTGEYKVPQPAGALPPDRARARAQGMTQMILEALVVLAHNVARGGNAARPIVRGFFTDTNEFRFAEFYPAPPAPAPGLPPAPAAPRVAFSEVMTWDYTIVRFDRQDPQHWLNVNARITAFFVAELVRSVLVKAWVNPPQD